MSTSTAADTEELTDRQRQVLGLHREGKNPTEIGKAVGISSQAVHGHFRRLREKGLIEAETPTARRQAGAPRSTSRKLDPRLALDAVHEAARQQIVAVEARQGQIEQEITSLQAEKRELTATLKELRKHTGEEVA